jgi:hypothetical protein
MLYDMENFHVRLHKTNVSDNKIILYRMGTHVDISRGPLISNTDIIGRCTVTAVSVTIFHGPILVLKYRYWIPQIPGKIREVFNTGIQYREKSRTVLNTDIQYREKAERYWIQVFNTTIFFRAVSDAVSKYVSSFFEN